MTTIYNHHNLQEICELLFIETTIIYFSENGIEDNKGRDRPPSGVHKLTLYIKTNLTNGLSKVAGITSVPFILVNPISTGGKCNNDVIDLYES